MELTEIVEKINEETKNLRSLYVSLDAESETIVMRIAKYRYGDNYATAKQLSCIRYMPNVSIKSNATLAQMNKYCASAIISAAKDYPNVRFYVCK